VCEMKFEVLDFTSCLFKLYFIHVGFLNLRLLKNGKGKNC
jgi:hypothetical protein